MVDLQPQHEAQRTLQTSRSSGWRRYRGALAAAAFALVAGLWIVLPSRGDTALSAAEQAQRAAAFEAAGPFTVVAVSAQERAGAVAGMQLPAAARATLERELDTKKVELVWLTFWDDRDEDGDTIQVESDGFMQLIRLANRPVTIAVPRPAQGIVRVRGTYDGGGGITMAARVKGLAVPMPVMTVGQVIGIPVR